MDTSSGYPQFTIRSKDNGITSTAAVPVYLETFLSDNVPSIGSKEVSSALLGLQPKVASETEHFL